MCEVFIKEKIILVYVRKIFKLNNNPRLYFRWRVTVACDSSTGLSGYFYLPADLRKSCISWNIYWMNRSTNNIKMTLMHFLGLDLTTMLLKNILCLCFLHTEGFEAGHHNRLTLSCSTDDL